MKIERRIDIAAPPEAVYDLVMDPRRLGEWVTVHAGLKDAPASALEEGSELTQCLKVAGQRFNVRWRVIEDGGPTRVVWEGRGPVRTRARVVYSFNERGNGTQFSYLNEYELPGGPLGKAAGRAVGRMAARESERTLERLKDLLEGAQ